MAYDGLISAFLGQGDAAGRPVAPNVMPGAIVFYYAQDTHALSFYADGVWHVLGVGGDLLSTNNLSDLASIAAARTNLALLRIIPFFFTTVPTASEVMAIYTAVDDFTIPANLSGTRVSVGTNPAATFALDVQKNGSTIATISISTGGVATLTTVGGTAKSIVAGDVIKIVAPVTPDTTIANVGINIKGTL
jgi:hypothetical protein